MVWCSICQYPGHWTSQCKYSHNMPSCRRCGRDSHSYEQCYASVGIFGEILSDSDEDEVWSCEHCGKEFDTEKGAMFHENKWCKKKPRSARADTKRASDTAVPSSVASVLRHNMAQPTGGVYVLKLDDGCFYVGKSSNVDARVAQHASGSVHCASWCKSHGVTNIQRMKTECPPSGDDLDAWEKNETLVQMMRHGVDKVRGWAFTNESLNMDQLVTLKTLLTEQADVCRRCGFHGHFVSTCSEANVTKAPWLQNLQDSIDALASANAVSQVNSSLSSRKRQELATPSTDPLSLSCTKRSKCTNTNNNQRDPLANANDSFTEQAKTGRARCQQCSHLIAKGEWRRGRRIKHPTFGLITKFTHFTCPESS
jgi:hypothetical protein